MSIVRLQHIGLAVADLQAACARLEQLCGLTARDYRNNQGRGMQLDARVLVGNGCWLHLVQNWNPESRVNQFLMREGPGLEHVSLQTDSIEADVEHLRSLGVPIYADKIFNAPDGFEAFVYPDQTLCMTVELIQPHTTSWDYPDTGGGALSSMLRITRLQHVGMAVREVNPVCERFEQLFGLKAVTARADNETVVRIPLPNDCWLQVTGANGQDAAVKQYLERHGAGLEHLAFETRGIEADAASLAKTAAAPPPVIQRNGQELWVGPDPVLGTRIELFGGEFR